MNLHTRLSRLEALAPTHGVRVAVEYSYDFYGNTARLRECIAKRLADIASGRFVPVSWGDPALDAQIHAGWEEMLRELSALPPAPPGIVIADDTGLEHPPQTNGTKDGTDCTASDPGATG